MKKLVFLTTIIFVLILEACTMAQENPLPDGKPGALYTEAAMTVSVQLTAANRGKNPATISPSTPGAESTLPAPTDTFIIFPNLHP